MKKVLILCLCISAALLLAGCTTKADPSPGKVSTSPMTSPMTSSSPAATSLPEAAKDMLHEGRITYDEYQWLVQELLTKG